MKNKVVLVGLDFAIKNYMSKHIDILSINNEVYVLALDNFFPNYSRRSLYKLPYELYKVYIYLKCNKINDVISVGPKSGFFNVIISFFLDYKSYHWFTGQTWLNFDKVNLFSLNFFLDYFLVNTLNFSLCDSRPQAALYKKLFRKKLYYPKFGSINGINSFSSHPRSIDKHSITIGFLGRLAEDKHVNTLILFAKQFPSINFIICGPLDLDYRLNIPDIDNLTVIQKYCDPDPFYEQIDIFVSLSSREGFCSVLIEAQGHGIPVLVYKIRNVSTSLLEGFTGLLIDNFEPSTFIKSVNKIVEQYSFFSTNALLFSKRFLPEYHLSSLSNVYNKVSLND